MSSSSSLPLSIHLDETRFAIPHHQHLQQSLLITGYLKATFPAEFDQHDQLTLIGSLRSQQAQAARVLYNDVIIGDSLRTHRHPQDNCYYTPFAFRIHHPHTLLPTIQNTLVTINYGVHYFNDSTHANGCTLSAPFELYTGSININKHHPSTNLYWGTTGDAWRYEIEVPRNIHLERQSSCILGDPVITVRLRSGWRHNIPRRHHTRVASDVVPAAADAVELESCLIGCRLEETTWLDKASKTSKPVKETASVTTHVLVPPSLSWSTPCCILIANDDNSNDGLAALPSVSLPDNDILEIIHHLCISLVFSESADRLDLRVPVTVIHADDVPMTTNDSSTTAIIAAPSPIDVPSRRLSSASSSTIYDDDCDSKSRDSGVWLSC